MNVTKLSHTLARPALAAALLAAFPLTSASSAVSPAPAATTVATPGATPEPEALTQLSGALQAQHLATLKTRGDAEITRRLTNLNAAAGKITSLTTLTAGDKSTLTTQVQNEVSGLTALKAKLDGDTTLAAARADVQSIVTEYRVYLLMLPKTHLVSAADRLAAAETDLISLQTKLQNAVQSQKAAGKTVTSEQASLTDMQTKLTAAQAALNGVATKLLALQPSDYNTNHTVLEQFRSSLGSAQADLKAARTDAAAVIADVSGTASPSASPSASASPAAN